MFRPLRAEEIEVRPQVVKETKQGVGCSLLLYKDARADMTILDECVGAKNWQRHHSRDNKNCIVSIWDKDKEQWIQKEDTGTESNTEKEKGLASDSFKRACFNWGIGRELYTSPFVWINLTDDEYYKKSQNIRLKPSTKFKVGKIEVYEGKIVYLTITDRNNKERFRFQPLASKEDIAEIESLAKTAGYTSKIKKNYPNLNKIDKVTAKKIINRLDVVVEEQKAKANG